MHIFPQPALLFSNICFFLGSIWMFYASVIGVYWNSGI